MSVDLGLAPYDYLDSLVRSDFLGSRVVMDTAFSLWYLASDFSMPALLPLYSRIVNETLNCTGLFLAS